MKKTGSDVGLFNSSNAFCLHFRNI